MIAPLPAFKAELAEVFPGVVFHVDMRPGLIPFRFLFRAKAKRHRTVWVMVSAEEVLYQVGRCTGATLREADDAHLRSCRRAS